MNQKSDHLLAACDSNGRSTSRWPAAISWMLLDWAASAFSTISITLLVAYVEKIVFVDNVWGVPGGVVWAWTLATAMLASALVAPVLAAWADRHCSHKQVLFASVLVGSGACLFLGIAPPEARLGIALLIGLGTVAFDMASIFTGSLLPSMTSGDGADRLSAAGFAAGYAGGAIALVAATAIVTAHDALGLSTAGALRVAFVLVGIWWLAFSLPAACVQFGSVHSDSTQAPSGSGQRHASTSVGELIAFARSLGAGGWHPLGTMLLGAVLVLGTVQTAISQFSSVALEEFHLDSPALVRLVLLVQLLAMPGAIAIGWISVRWSRQVALSICLTGWAAVLGLAFLVNSPRHLMALAILLALVLGGVQSVLRTSVAVLAPAGRFGTTFGLMQVGTKLAGFAASLIFGLVYAASGQPRGGLVVLLAQLLAGWWILSRATRER